MAKRDPPVDEYIEKSAEFARPCLHGIEQQPRTPSRSTAPNGYCFDDSAVVGSMTARTSEI
jgi:hypothetical protein